MRKRPDIHVDRSAYIASDAAVGAPHRALIQAESTLELRATRIGARCWIGHGVILVAGAQVGDGSVIDHGCLVDANVDIGERVLLTYGARVGVEAVIEDDCVIGGFVAEGSHVGARSRIFGALIHSQCNPTAHWDSEHAMEPSPVVEPDAFIGWGARVVGEITIASGAYVAANAVVTRSVPARHVAIGVNHLVPIDRWPGDLGRSPLFRDQTRSAAG